MASLRQAISLTFCTALALLALVAASSTADRPPPVAEATPAAWAYDPALSPAERAVSTKLVAAAWDRTRRRVAYDPSYVELAYPGGDVPDDRGVCSDVIVRAYRALGVDLQKLVHEDMVRDFGKYPARWGLSRPDPNIDHRRVPNLAAFFTRHGRALPTSRDAATYHAGELVTWNLDGAGDLPPSHWLRDTGTPHIGIVTDRRAPSGRPLIVHNIGAGPQAEDVLLAWRITGHFRFFGRD